MNNCLFAIPVFGGVVTFLIVLLQQSEEKNAVFFGLSKMRLVLAALVLFLTLFCYYLFRSRRRKMPFLYYISGAAFILSAEILLFSRFPHENTANQLPLLAEKTKPILLWMLISSVLWLAALILSGTEIPGAFVYYLTVTAVVIYLGISTYIAETSWNLRLDGNTAFCLVTLISLTIWFMALRSGIGRKYKTAFGCLFFMLLGFSVTRITGMWMGRILTPPKAYWNELAEAFLSGRLYLEHPSGYHDLTQYGGKWYVPNPPLPGILLIPWTACFGTAAPVNTCVYSAVISGINSGLFFLLLILAYTHKGGPFYEMTEDDSAYPGNSLSIAVWVTILFVFGTDHLWLGTTGQMWFVSQLLVVTFTLFACIFAICRFSPFIVGAALGLGMLCRPNIFPVWFCLLGIWLFQQRPFPQIPWKKAFFWCLKSGVPIVVSVFLLLLYNKVRFDSWLDFGYVSINGADWILESVREYGMFHPHFFRTNARVMLYELPVIDLSGERFFFQPHVSGYSIFLMTPPLIYIFRSFRKNWYSIGAWASVVISAALLLLYHNTGAEQIGYRYLLDISAPLSLLVTDGLRGKVSVLFKVLTVFAIVLSYVGIYWWYLGRV